MNKGEIRTRVLEQVDWQPDQSTAFKAKVDQMINRAYNLLALEAPFLFFEEDCRIITQPDASTGTHASDKLLRSITDNRVLQRYALKSKVTDGTIKRFAADGTWDGRMLEVTLATGETYRRRIREITSSEDASVEVGGVTLAYERQIITLETPWDYSTVSYVDWATTETGLPDLSYRIFTPEYELPADVVELRSARLFGDNHYQLSVRNQNDMERYDYVDFQGEHNGRPSSLFRGKHWQIDAPMLPPTITRENENEAGASSKKWLGPDSKGTFEYCFTYVWGKRDKELQAPKGLYEPKWESAPSPVSTKMTHDGTDDGFKLTFPFIDQALDDYYDNDNADATITSRALRKGESGHKIRIYVRRTASEPNLYIPVHPMEDGVFYLLAEISGGAEHGDVTYYHQGHEMPEYRRRLKEVHGYQTIRFHPMPDARYEVDCRVLRKPQKLVNDQDAPRIHVEAAEALIQKTLSMLQVMEGLSDSAALTEQRYMSVLNTLTKRYGMIPGSRPKKKIARARRPIRETRVRYTETS